VCFLGPLAKLKILLATSVEKQVRGFVLHAAGTPVYARAAAPSSRKSRQGSARPDEGNACWEI